MAISLALIILLGLLSDYLFRLLRLPGLIGMLITGVLLGPHYLNVIDSQLLSFSADFRMLALIVIMLRAGLAMKRDTLNRVGKPALLMGSIPALCEGFAIMAASLSLFGLSPAEGAVLGCVVAAVSPAVVVPSMIRFIDERKGAKKGIPTMLLASATLDNVFVLVLFSAAIGMHEGKTNSLFMNLLDIPVSLITGIVLGIISGFMILEVFKRFHPRATKKALVVIGVALLLVWVEKMLKPFVSVSSVAGIITTGFLLLERSEADAHKVAQKLGKIWVLAEILLFVLIGAQVNIPVAWNAGLSGAVLIAAGLAARGIGTYLSLIFTGLNMKEKAFCMVSFVPKATVQAAVGAIPLSMGMKSGEIILAISVLSILLTAPIGAIAMDIVGERVLENHHS